METSDFQKVANKVSFITIIGNTLFIPHQMYLVHL